MTEIEKPNGETVAQVSGESGKDIYPPPVSYEWVPVEDFSKANQSVFQELVDANVSEYKPKEVVMMTGRIEEQTIVGLAFASSMSNLARTRNDFPRVETRETHTGIYSTSQLTAVGSMRIIFTRENGENYLGYMFIQHKGANDAQYKLARTMYLDSINDTLEEIKRNKIPPPPAIPTPTK